MESDVGISDIRRHSVAQNARCMTYFMAQTTLSCHRNVMTWRRDPRPTRGAAKERGKRYLSRLQLLQTTSCPAARCSSIGKLPGTLNPCSRSAALLRQMRRGPGAQWRIRCRGRRHAAGHLDIRRDDVWVLRGAIGLHAVRRRHRLRARGDPVRKRCGLQLDATAPAVADATLGIKALSSAVRRWRGKCHGRYQPHSSTAAVADLNNWIESESMSAPFPP